MNLTSSKEELLELYKAKLGSADDAAALLKDGSVCGSDIALANSGMFFDAVARRIDKGELKNIYQHSLLDTYPAPFFEEQYKDSYHAASWFTSGFGRKSCNQAICDIMPAYYSDFPSLYRDYIQPDVYVGVVSPMDAHGYFSTGTAGSCSAGILSSAKQIFIEVNPNMPRAVYGEQIHISQVTALWENDKPIFTMSPKPIDDTSRKIGQLIAAEVPDGACLQLGIGAIPDAVGLALQSKKHLGIHTEMFTDSMISLIECGAVDNSCKELYRGKTVAAFAMGSRKMYDYIDDNPAVAMLPVDFVNSPYTVGQLSNFISVNAAIEVDFFGQVCAESIGTRHVSGTGGHRDFVRGALNSKGGKSFIAFTATAKGGTESKIVPTLKPGAQVSTGKNDVDMIVTEYGIARMHGRTLSQRAKALIAIADPKFRDELTFAAKKENIII